MMNDFSRRVHSVVVKNLPKDFTEHQLEELFLRFGRINSSKVLPYNPSMQGVCGFVNYADVESCQQAVEFMNNYSIEGSTLQVSHSSSRTMNNSFDRSQSNFRTNGESINRTMSATSVNLDDNNGISSPTSHTRFSSFRPASVRSSNSIHSNTNELNTTSNGNKILWNSNINQQDISNSKSPLQNEIIQQQMNIQEHESFVINKTYSVYLSNLEVPNIVFAATLDDYVNATLLITQMNKHGQLVKVQANSYKTKLSIGQICAALFNNDWYRARVLEIGETRVRVQYIDWGNTGWCDSTLEIRPLPNEYFKDAVLCVKCILDSVPSNEKLSKEQTNAILGILVLDLKLEMTVLRIENGIPYVRLNLDERNLNNEICAILSSSSAGIKQNQIINFDLNKPELNLSEIHCVQLTTVDTVSEYFHVLLMRDCLSTIMNVLKDWNSNKQPLTIPPKSNMLVCAQYDADDLWYRAWIKNVNENGYHVYFVDFGNEEIVSIDRLSDCPDILKNIPWQSVQIKLANIKLTDDERYLLLKDFETDRLDMKIIQKNQDIYLVDLLNNGKSLVEYILELRKKQQQQQLPITPINHEVPKLPTEPIQQFTSKVSTPVPMMINENTPQISNENPRPISQPIQPIIDMPKQFTLSNDSKIFQPTITSNTTSTITTDTGKKPLFSSANTFNKQLSTTEQMNDTSINENLTTLITEQRRQNRLLEQVIAAINTTNALLGQLVQR